jgi:hypothetical protein
VVFTRGRRARRARRPWYRRSEVLWVVGSVVGVLAVLGLFAAFRLASVAKDLNHARSLLESASDHIEQGQLAAARGELSNAQTILTHSNDQLYGAVSLELLDLVPIAHQNLASLRNTVGLALRMTDGANHILAVTRPLESASGKLEVPLDNGKIPLQAVQDAQAATDQLAAVLPQPGVRPNQSLVAGPIAHAQDLLYQQAEIHRTQLDGLSHGLKLLAALSGESGPKRYLIAVANPAEMRGAGGMILSYGVLEADAGTFELGDFGKIDELFLDDAVDPASLALPADYLKRWGNLEPTRLWRNTTVNPDFTLDAPILEAMFTAKTGLSVDGVIQIDPVGLGAILTGTGPVSVEGLGDVSADNVVDLTLNRAYIDFPDRDQRQELLGDVARAAFDKLVGGKLDTLRPLGEALFDATLARHVMLYANDPQAERESRFFSASGELPPASGGDYALLTVQNFSKNKLDYYLDTSLSITGTRPTQKAGSLTATITMANTAPQGVVSEYVFGPNAEGEEAGLYRAVVSLYLPNGVSVASVSGDPTTTPPTETADAGRSVVTFNAELRPGESRTVTVQLSLVPRAKGAYSLTFVPIGRVRQTVVSADVSADGERVFRPAGPLTAPVTLRAPQ